MPTGELCLADGSDDGHDAVGELCRKYAEKIQELFTENWIRMKESW